MPRNGQQTRDGILEAAERLILTRGFAGTSVDDVLAATGITKGAFFYHFKTKADLARAVAERYWERDFDMLARLMQRAEALSEDPLQAMLIFLKLFAEQMAGLNETPAGCLFAAFVYQDEQFEADVRQFVTGGFDKILAFFEVRFARIEQKYAARVAASPRELAETLVCIIQGGFILARSLQEVQLMARTIHNFHRYVQLIFNRA